MANTYRVVHCFQGEGGTSDDQYCNQFYFFSATDHAPGDVASWGGLLANYVHQLFVSTTGGVSISRYYHPRCAGNLGVTKIYDVTGAPATTGPPIFTISDSTLVPTSEYLADLDISPGSEGLPEEVAVCLSYQAISTGGDLPRRRGRIYLGPLNKLALEEGGDMETPTRVSTVFMNAIVGAAQQVQEAAAANDFEWRVFSTMDGFAFKIVKFIVDDAFDTIRGRGQVPATRITLPIS